MSWLEPRIGCLAWPVLVPARWWIGAFLVASCCAVPCASAQEASPAGNSGSSNLQQVFDEVQNSTSAELMQKLSAPFLGSAGGAARAISETGAGTATRGAAPRTQGEASVQRFVAPTLPPPEGAHPAPRPRVEGTLPLVGSAVADDVQLSQNSQGLITLVVRDASLSRVLALLAQTQGLNVVAANDIDAIISITLRDVPLEDALTAILSVANYTWVRKNNIILITSLTDGMTLPASVQGRQIQVFNLDFAKASVVSEAITHFLSPIGKVSFTEGDPNDNRKTRESVVVEDLPESLRRIAAYINYVDQPPRQVQIEAHILQVKLDDENEQGVDLDALFRIANSNLTLKTVGFADQEASSGFVATLEGGDIGAVINLLQTTEDAKTLGSPRVMVLNEQEARIQVGRKDGYLTSTTTETSTVQNVEFLETGVILTIRPRISRDNRVLLHVRPEISDGSVNENTGLPNEETRNVETSVMLRDGQGMVIGGLIEERDVTHQSKVPYLGDVKGLGWFFRKSTVVKERREVIVALVPRVLPYGPEWQAYEEGNLVKAGVPLFEGPLCRTYRPFDPILPDGMRVTRPIIPNSCKCGECADFYDNVIGGVLGDLREYPTYPIDTDYYVPRHPLPRQQFYGGDCPEIEFARPGGAPFLSDEELPPPGEELPLPGAVPGTGAGDPFGE